MSKNNEREQEPMMAFGYSPAEEAPDPTEPPKQRKTNKKHKP